MTSLIHINLLPVRERQTVNRKRIHLFVELTVVAFTVGILLALTWRDRAAEFNLSTRLRALDRNVTASDAPKTAALLQEHLDAYRRKLAMLEGIEQTGTRYENILRTVARAVPSSVWLTRFEMNGNTLILEGRTKEQMMIAQFLRELALHPSFADNQLIGVQQPKEVAHDTARGFSTRTRIVSKGLSTNRREKTE